MMNYLLNLSLHAYIVREIEVMRDSDQYNEIEKRYLARWHTLLSDHTTLEQDYCAMRVQPYSRLMKKVFFMVSDALRETRPFENEQGLPVYLFFRQ